MPQIRGLLWGLLLLSGLVHHGWAATFPGTSDPTLADQQRWGSASQGYVVSGCTHGTTGTTSASITTCKAFTVDTAGPAPALKGLQETTATTLTYTGGDGQYFVLTRANPGVTPPGGWTCPAGTHYCWLKTATRPMQPSGTLLILRVTVSGNAITEARPLFATNGVNPGRIYATDPYIGMQCDGHTDDSAALQRAVDLSEARGGVGIELPAGTCVVRNILIENNATPGGLDAADARMGCASLVGQGAGKTILTPPDTALPTDYVLKASCTPLGAGHFASPYPGNYPGGVTLADFSIYGRQNRTLETHGLLLEGGYVHVRDVRVHSINGRGVTIGETEKLESAWIYGMHVRHSGRYITDGGRSDGLPGSSNEAAIKFAEPSNGQNSNNISFYGLQIGFPWYTGLEMDCEPNSFVANVFFYAGMYHGNEDVDATNQGRLHTKTGITWVHGNCFNIAFHGANANAPGSDHANTNEVTGPPVPIFHLDDIDGVEGDDPATTGPDSVFFSDIYLNQSCCGEGIRISAARAVTLNGVRGGTNDTLDFPDGQLVIVPAPDIVLDGTPPPYPGGNDQLLLTVCQSVFDANFTRIAYKDVEKIRDCGRQVYSQRVESDSDRRRPVSSTSTWTLGAGTFPATVDKAHLLPCTPSAAHITLTLTDEPDECTAQWVTNITSTQYTINCLESGGNGIGGDGVTGGVQIVIPEGCTTPALLPLSQTPFITSLNTRVYIHGITWTSNNPGVALNASHYATLTVSKRKILSDVPFATLTTQTTNLPAWTPTAFTITTPAELIWDPQDSLGFTITKTGNGVALEAGVLTIIVGTNVLADE